MSPPTWGFPLLAHRGHAHRDPCTLTALRTCSLAHLQQHRTFVAWRTCSLVCIQDCTLTALQACNPTCSRPCTLAASCAQDCMLPALRAPNIACLQRCTLAALHGCSLARLQPPMLPALRARGLARSQPHSRSIAHVQPRTPAALHACSPTAFPAGSIAHAQPPPCCSGQPRASSLPALLCHGLSHFSSFKGNFILIFFLFSKIKFIRAEAVAEGGVGWLEMTLPKEKRTIKQYFPCTSCSPFLLPRIPREGNWRFFANPRQQLIISAVVLHAL